MVAITCNVPNNLLGKDTFQEIDITGVTMPITKHNFIVKDVTKLADTIRRAFIIAKSGRPGPVLIDITKETNVELIELHTLYTLSEEEENQEEKQKQLDFLYALNRVKKPKWL